MYSGDALALEDQDSNITYMIPEEGVSFYIDSMAILQDAPHAETAYQFINYILDPEVGASLTNELYYASPNSAAKE